MKIAKILGFADYHDAVGMPSLCAFPNPLLDRESYVQKPANLQQSAPNNLEPQVLVEYEIDCKPPLLVSPS